MHICTYQKSQIKLELSKVTVSIFLLKTNFNIFRWDSIYTYYVHICMRIACEILNLKKNYYINLHEKHTQYSCAYAHTTLIWTPTLISFLS